MIVAPSKISFFIRNIRLHRIKYNLHRDEILILFMETVTISVSVLCYAKYESKIGAEMCHLINISLPIH